MANSRFTHRLSQLIFHQPPQIKQESHRLLGAASLQRLNQWPAPGREDTLIYLTSSAWKKNYNLMKCENTRLAIQWISVKYHGLEVVPNGNQLSHAALITVHPQTCTSRIIFPGLPSVGCWSPRLHRWLTKKKRMLPSGRPCSRPRWRFQNSLPSW